MKLYYRKGLIRGLGITLLGVAFLLGDIFCFEEIEANIIWSIIIIVGGICDCLRCFSKKKTIFYKGIMPSEKVLDFPVDCNTLTGSVNL